MIKKLIAIVSIVLIVGVGGVVGAIIAAAPEGPPAGSESERRLEPGPYRIASIDRTFVDESRPTPANGDAPRIETRSLVTTIWYPTDFDGPHPLVVYSHGFMSFRGEAKYVAAALASRGYVVISADYPLTHFGASGGPKVDDFIHQPADVSFLIDSMLQWVGEDKPYRGRIDPDRIGVAGLSLGALTTTLVTFHPKLRDSRVRAAVSIAGPGGFFGERFFRSADVPFLMVAGTQDAMIDYEENALVVPRRAPTGALLSIEGASHAGFAAVSAMFFRLMDNPDTLGCWAILRSLDPSAERNFFAELGGETEGIDTTVASSLPCQDMPLPVAMHAERQQMITELAVMDFFESVFSEDAATRETASRHLVTQLGRDFPEVRYQAYEGGGRS